MTKVWLLLVAVCNGSAAGGCGPMTNHTLHSIDAAKAWLRTWDRFR
jgi:hypothetical protein